MTTRADIVAEARTWLQTPWVHQHRVKGHAVDCVGLVIGVARNLGLVPPEFDVQGYSRLPDGHLEALCERYMRPVSRSALQPGDVVVVAVAHDPQHMGIVTPHLAGGLGLIHATSVAKRGGVVESRLMFTRVMQFRAAYALPGVD